MLYDDFLLEYQRRSGNNRLLSPTEFGFPTMGRLLEAIQLVAVVRGRKYARTLILNTDFKFNSNHQQSIFT